MDVQFDVRRRYVKGGLLSKAKYVTRKPNPNYNGKNNRWTYGYSLERDGAQSAVIHDYIVDDMTGEDLDRLRQVVPSLPDEIDTKDDLFTVSNIVRQAIEAKKVTAKQILKVFKNKEQ